VGPDRRAGKRGSQSERDENGLRNDWHDNGQKSEEVLYKDGVEMRQASRLLTGYGPVTGNLVVSVEVLPL